MKYLSFFLYITCLVAAFAISINTPEKISSWGFIMLLALMNYISYVHEDLKEKIKNNNQ